MKTSYLAFAITAVGTGVLILACGGAETSDVLGAPAQATASSSGASGTTDASSSGTGTSGSASGGTSGTTSGGTSGTTSGGTSGTSSGTTDACAGCAAPPAGCSYPNPCDCTLKCEDAGVVPTKCDWKVAGSCPDGFFCDAIACGAGTCAKKPQVEQVQREPACGCDGVTYWNSNVARFAGVPIKSGGACAGDAAAKCGGLLGSACPGAGASCNQPVKNKQSCAIADSSGTCWKLPAACPPVAGNLRAHPCASTKCTSECEAIRSDSSWYDDGSCPN